MSKFSTVVADPPWNVKAGPGNMPYTIVDGKQVWDAQSRPSRDLAYPSMTVADIAALPVADLCAPDAHLYLWTINKYVDEAFDVARAWGFKYSTMLTWNKKPMGGGLGGCYGINSEFILFCRRGSLKALGRQKRTVFDWKRPYKNGYPQHSAKPPEFFEMVAAMSPGPHLEMFARNPRADWSVWGNEVVCDVALT
jgi:N6-adenosine-specific RNA methylase IME4